MCAFHISIDQAGRDVLELASAHRAWVRKHSPPEDVHALDAEALTEPAITLLTARTPDGELLGMAALREVGAEHAEVKSMHVRPLARGQGVGRALVTQLVEVARQRGCRRVSLETGTMDAFVSARLLYAGLGFTPCPPFGDYTASPNSVCMTLPLEVRR